MKNKYTKNLLKITKLSLLSIFLFSGTGICAEKISGESIKTLLTGETFILVNLSNNRRSKKHFREDGTWVEFTDNGLRNDFGAWRVNSLSQFCQTSNFKVGKENCTYIWKEGDNYLTYYGKESKDCEKIITAVTAWERAADYVATNVNDENNPDIANIRKKALESIPAAGKTDEGRNYFLTIKKSLAEFFDWHISIP